MTTNRRKFLAAGIAAAGTTPLGNRAFGANDATIECLDYGRSFICHPSTSNAVRFWVESRTTLYDDRAGNKLEILQCGSCKSENTFAKQDLLKKDNYNFMPIVAGDDVLFINRFIDVRRVYKQHLKAEQAFGKPIPRLHFGAHVTELKTFEEIRDANATDIPLAAQTEVVNEETGLRCIMEYPIKTMNVSIDDSLWQVDTGPVVFPDLTQRFAPPLECARLAYAAFNAPHFCDFVIEQPTPILRDGKEVCEVFHYSNPVSFPSQNRVLAVEGSV